MGRDLSEYTSDALEHGAHIVKGNSMRADEASLVRVSASDDGDADFRAHNTGFRCVR